MVPTEVSRDPKTSGRRFASVERWDKVDELVAARRDAGGNVSAVERGTSHLLSSESRRSSEICTLGSRRSMVCNDNRSCDRCNRNI